MAVAGISDALQGLPAGAVWVAALSLFGLFVRQWVPLKKLKVEEDASLRKDLMAIAEQARKDADSARKEAAEARHDAAEAREQMADERRDCERRIKALEEQVAGLTRMIAQNSQSTAQLISDPVGAATSKAAQKARGETE